jgi:hypothetical protein
LINEIDDQLPKNQRRTAQRLFEGLVGEGYTGAYDSIQRYVKQWKIDNFQKTIHSYQIQLLVGVFL